MWFVKVEKQKRSKRDLDFLSLVSDNNVLQDKGVFDSEYTQEYKCSNKEDTLAHYRTYFSFNTKLKWQAEKKHS